LHQVRYEVLNQVNDQVRRKLNEYGK